MMQPEATVESLLRSTLQMLEGIPGALTDGATDIAVSTSVLMSMHVMLQAAVHRLPDLPDDPDAPARGVLLGSLIAGAFWVGMAVCWLL
jgi:hypothetical protein